MRLRAASSWISAVTRPALWSSGDTSTSDTEVATEEKTLKLTPPPLGLAPWGAGEPRCSAYSTADAAAQRVLAEERLQRLRAERRGCASAGGGGEEDSMLLPARACSAPP